MPIKKHAPKVNYEQRDEEVKKKYNFCSPQSEDNSSNPAAKAQENSNKLNDQKKNMEGMDKKSNKIFEDEVDIDNKATSHQQLIGFVTELIKYIVGNDSNKRFSETDRHIFHNACVVYLSHFFSHYLCDQKRALYKKKFSKYSPDMFSPQNAALYSVARILAFWQWGSGPYWVGGAQTRVDVSKIDIVVPQKTLTKEEIEGLVESERTELKEIKIAAVFYKNIYPKILLLAKSLQTPEIKEKSDQAIRQCQENYSAITDRVQASEPNAQKSYSF